MKPGEATRGRASYRDRSLDKTEMVNPNRLRQREDGEETEVVQAMVRPRARSSFWRSMKNANANDDLPSVVACMASQEISLPGGRLTPKRWLSMT